MPDVDLMIYQTAKKLGLPLKPSLHVIKTRRVLANYTAYRRRRKNAASVICVPRQRLLSHFAIDFGKLFKGLGLKVPA